MTSENVRFVLYFTINLSKDYSFFEHFEILLNLEIHHTRVCYFNVFNHVTSNAVLYLHTINACF